jgi:hypothetical protein
MTRFDITARIKKTRRLSCCENGSVAKCFNYFQTPKITEEDLSLIRRLSWVTAVQIWPPNNPKCKQQLCVQQVV